MPSRSATLRTMCVAALILAGCAAPQPLPIDRVIRGAHGGAEATGTIEAMRSARTTYALRGSDFARLKAAGVSDEVLDYIQQSFIDDVDLLTRYWVLGESVGGCTFCVPVEVDLGNIDAPRQRPTSTATRFDRPQGMPSWYRPYSAHRGTLTVAQIRSMAAAHIPDAQIVQALQTENLQPVLGVGGLGTVRTRPLAGLTGSQLAHLGSEGVSDAVLDALQTAFLAQFVEVERLRYQNLGKGPHGGFN